MRRLRRARRRYAGGDKFFRHRILAAGTATVLSLGGAGLAGRAIPTNDRHQILAAPDADRDFLTNQEELALGYQPLAPDQNRNTFPDGVELAIRCAEAISQLPRTPDPNDPARIHAEERWMAGKEMCEICGQFINMGTVRVVNPGLGQHVELPFLALHCMEHGSFSHAGDVHKGRVTVPALLRALDLRFPHELDPHRLPLDYSAGATGRLAPDANDLDGDLLADSEELAAGLNLHDADQNENLASDGIELACRFAEIIDRLPTFGPNVAKPKDVHKVNFLLRGLEWCEICGESVNMGHWQVVNPTRGLSMDVPVIVCHYMQHGSFSYLSNVHGAGRADIAMLKQILEFPAQCGDLGTLRPPGDLTGDCRVDFRDLSVMADQWLRPTDAAGEQADRK